MNEVQLQPVSAPRASVEAGLAEPAPAAPLWFGPVGGELFGLYHEPSPPCRGTAVLLCNPFGYEAMCAHRAYLHLARTLSQRGFPVLRFDYHGTGDATGDDRDPDRWDTWLRSIHLAMDELRRLSGCGAVGGFGLRLGANLLLEAVATRTDVPAIALWGPFATGRAFLREELAVHKLRALDPAAAAAGRQVEGETEALGFAISGQTMDALKGVSVAELPGLQVPSVLVLTRDTPLQEGRVAEQLRALGTDVTSGAGTGYAAMFQDNRVPEQTWSQVADFFERVVPAADGRGGAAPGTSVSRTAQASVWRSPAGTAPVRETAGYFGPERRLFGVTTHACQEGAVGERSGVLLLSGGVNHHVGQNRMYVGWARRWARAGVSSLRFDLAGFGDSGWAHGGGDGQIHAAESVADVRAAMDYLGELCGIERFAIIGLCSGALQAFHVALADPRVTRLGLLNWTRFELDPPLGTPAAELGVPAETNERRYNSLRYYLRLATDRATWRRTLLGEVDLSGIAAHVAARSGRRLWGELQAWLAGPFGGAAARTQLARDFEQLAGRGVQACVVYNGDEPILDGFRERLGAQFGRLARRGHLRLEVVDGTDHVFTPLWSQEHVYDLMSKHVVIPTERPR